MAVSAAPAHSSPFLCSPPPSLSLPLAAPHLPSCDEPTTEVVFSSSSQGSVKVIISPLTKVTRLVDPQVSSVGAPMQLIASFGPYITGDSIDVDTDVVSATARTLPNGQEVYTYELSTPTALNGPHRRGSRVGESFPRFAHPPPLFSASLAASSVSALTFRGATAVLLVASANEKQWAAGAEELRKVVASFTIGG